MPARKKEPEDLTAKKELALEVIDRLKKEYPDAGCTLDYDHAWQLLVSVRLAAQCTDARVNIVVEDLFARYPSVAALAAAEPEDIEAIVKPCGLGHSKARDISACMRMLRDKYNCQVPTTFEELLARIRSIMRRPGKWGDLGLLKLGDVSFDPECGRLSKGAKECTLSKRESTLMEVFLRNPGQVLPRTLLLSRVWGLESDVEDGNLDNYIHFLRRRLHAVDSSLQLKTIRGVGYQMEVYH